MLSKRILVLMFLVLFLPLVGCLPTVTPPVIENQAPVITSDSVTTATVGVAYTYDVGATDPDGDTLTYSLDLKPTNMTINSETGVIKWIPYSTHVGGNPVTVEVSDGTLSDNQSFTIMVIGVEEPVTPVPPSVVVVIVNQAPIITSTPITTAIVGVTYTYDVNATDPEGDTITYSLDFKPNGMIIVPISGIISWEPTAKGDYDVIVKASDYQKAITQSFTIKVEAKKLTGIDASPDAVTLFVGNSDTVKSVTAHYNDGSIAKIPVLTFEGGTPACECESKNENIATVTDTGLITAVKEGATIITVSYTEGGITRTDNVAVTVITVGDSYGGGKIAYIFVEGDTGYVEGETHGLIAATEDATSTMKWSNIRDTAVGVTGTEIGDGQANTTAIVSQEGCILGAAYYCDTLDEGGYSDWFLPSKDELNKLYGNRVAIGGFGDDGNYWSSSEHSVVCYAWFQNFESGWLFQKWYDKHYALFVRAVRAF